MLRILWCRLRKQTYCPQVKRGCIKTDCVFYQVLSQGNDPETNKPIREDCVFMMTNYFLAENFAGLIRLQRAVEGRTNILFKHLGVSLEDGTDKS